MKKITIALAGNANVGKSVIFNQLTRGAEITGNWPKKKSRGSTVDIPLFHLHRRGSHYSRIHRAGKTRCGDKR
jgi:ferrous iron transport protein B